MSELHKLSVKSLKRVGSVGYLLSVLRPFDFTAGQIVGLTTDLEVEPRLYSIASGPADENLEILFTVHPEGELTPGLAGLKPFDHVWITGPRGRFTHRPGSGIWIATGTGVAPFRSMWRDGHRPAQFIQGARFLADLFFDEEFNGAATRVRCITGEVASDSEHGRIPAYLDNREKLPTDCDYYICGNGEMVSDVRRVLLANKVRFDKIVTEIYF